MRNLTTLHWKRFHSCQKSNIRLTVSYCIVSYHIIYYCIVSYIVLSSYISLSPNFTWPCWLEDPCFVNKHIDLCSQLDNHTDLKRLEILCALPWVTHCKRCNESYSKANDGLVLRKNTTPFVVGMVWLFPSGVVSERVKCLLDSGFYDTFEKWYL